MLVIAASVNGLGQDILQGEYPLAAGGLQNPFRPAAGVDVACQDIICIYKDVGGIIGEYHFALGAGLHDNGFVVFYIINPGKRMLRVSEKPAEILLSKEIVPGIHPFFIQQVLVHKVVPHLIRRIG